MIQPGKTVKISLVRHGRPAVNLRAGIRAREFAAWLRAYEETGLDRSLAPPEALRVELATCGLLLTSPARRATESADALGLRVRRGTVPEAREVPLPTQIIWPGCHPPTTFVVLARALWLLGLARAEEDRRTVRLRARQLARKLDVWSGESGHVVLVGHGYLNRFLREDLTRTGWRPAGRQTRGYWSCSHLERTEPCRRLTPGREMAWPAGVSRSGKGDEARSLSSGYNGWQAG